MNYQNGRIYKILNNIDDDVYVGSTCQTLSQRMTHHRSKSKLVNPTRLIYKKMQELGVKEFYIELIEECPCDSIEELLKREGYYIREIGTLNKIIAGRTNKEYRQDNKEKLYEQHKMYRENNKEKLIEYYKEWYLVNKVHVSNSGKQYREINKVQICEKKKEYNEINKKQISEHNKEYYQMNKEKFITKQNQYRETNKEQISEKKKITFVCQCGSTCRTNDKARHDRSVKHQQFITSE